MESNASRLQTADCNQAAESPKFESGVVTSIIDNEEMNHNRPALPTTVMRAHINLIRFINSSIFKECSRNISNL